jgi:hypothetical protein
MTEDVGLDIERKTFTSDLLPDLIAALGRCRSGDLIGLSVIKKALAPSWEPGADSPGIHYWKPRPNRAARAGSSAAGLFRRLPEYR